MTTVVSEYASALFTLAAEEDVKPEVAEAVGIIKALAVENPEYIDLLATPSISPDERAGLIEEAFGGRMHEYAVSFVKLLCERGHIRELVECIDEYLRIYEMSDGVVTAQVTSAVELSEAERNALAEKLEAKLSRRVVLECSVDPGILGGVIVRVDGKIMDGSLKTRIADVRSVIGG